MVNEWISVKENPPKEKRPILMVAVNCGLRGNYTTDQYAGWREEKSIMNDTEWLMWPHPFPPTHWMPLPAPPNK